jgi:hypothetical protein
MSRKNVVRVSGLDDEPPKPSGSQPNSANFSVENRPSMYSTTLPAVTKVSHISNVSQLSVESETNTDDDYSYVGERILTTKTQTELVHDLERLQRKYDQTRRLLQIEREKNRTDLNNNSKNRDETDCKSDEISTPSHMAPTDDSVEESAPLFVSSKNDGVPGGTVDAEGSTSSQIDDEEKQGCILQSIENV